MEIGVLEGGESNQTSSANVLAGENSKSIALRSIKAIKNVLNRLDPGDEFRRRGYASFFL